MIKQRDVV